MILRMIPGGDTIDYDALTAAAADVPEELTFIGKGSEEEQTGTLPNREKMHGAPGHSSSRPNVPVHQSVKVEITTDTNGDRQIAAVPPLGKYPGNTNAYVGIYPAEIGVEEDVIACGETVAGIRGTYGGDSTATTADVRDGKVYYDRGGRKIGEAGDYAAAAATLKCGESYEVKKGFHQAGKVSAATLSSQTQPGTGDKAAEAAQILTGYGAWSNGAYRDGSMPDKGNVAASDCTADDSSSELKYTIPETGRYTKDNYLSRTFAQVRTALGIVASVIKNGTTIAGLKGTYGSDATAEDSMILKGKTAYGKDGKITGTMVDKGNAKAADNKSDSSQIRFTIPETGRYTKDNYIYRTFSEVAALVGLTEGKLQKGQSVLGVSGTGTRCIAVTWSKKISQNCTGYSETASTRAVSIGSPYSDYDTVIIEIIPSTTYNGPITIALSKGKSFRVPITTQKYSNSTYQNAWTSVSRSTSGEIKFSPFRGNVSGTFDITVKIHAVCDGIINQDG